MKHQKNQNNQNKNLKLEDDLKKMIEVIKILEKDKKDINSKIKSLPEYKEFITKKKILEISTAYNDMKLAMTAFNGTQEFSDRKELNKKISDLKEQIFAIEDELGDDDE